MLTCSLLNVEAVFEEISGARSGRILIAFVTWFLWILFTRGLKLLKTKLLQAVLSFNGVKLLVLEIRSSTFSQKVDSKLGLICLRGKGNL